MDAAIAAHCTATGRVLLAHASPEALEDYISRVRFLSYTRYTITDVQQVRELLTRVRRDGYAINDQEFVTGSTGIAAPVFSAEGNVAAAINLGTLTSRYVERREELLAYAAFHGGPDQPRTWLPKLKRSKPAKSVQDAVSHVGVARKTRRNRYDSAEGPAHLVLLKELEPTTLLLRFPSI